MKRDIPFDQEVWDQIQWIQVSDNMCLPDIGSMLLWQLAKSEGASLDMDPKVVGEQITRQLSERKGDYPTGLKSFRLSGAGNCLRRMAMDFHGVEPNGFKGGAGSRIVFAYGDAVEAMVTLALVEACTHLPVVTLTNVLDEQETVVVQINVGDKPWMAFRVPGHPDGGIETIRWLRGETPQEAWAASQEAPIKAVFECKSASDFGYKKFRDEGLKARDDKGNPDGYYYQTQGYQLARRQRGEDVAWGYVLYFGKSATAKDAVISDSFEPGLTQKKTPRKTFVVENENMWWKTGPVAGRWVPRDDVVQQDLVDRFKAVAASDSPDEFKRIQKPQGKAGVLKFPCDWCHHLKNCFPGAHEVGERKGWFHTVTKVTTQAGE